MTAQIGDQFRYEGLEYSIVAISEPLRFDPSKYGITPVAVCSACWQGYWCHYDITSEGIFLEDLYISSKDDYYPAIEGVTPLRQPDSEANLVYMGHQVYKGLHIKMPYTGKLLIGKEFLHDYYIHMGYQRAWAYNVLVQLVFKNGRVIEQTDESKTAEQIRKKLAEDKKYEKMLSKNPKKFVNECFSLDYDVKAWWL